MAEVSTAKKHRDRFESFLNTTEPERARAERRRDYRDLKQWTPEQVAKLEARKQAPIVFDQFSQKVDAICGLEIQGRSDPKALPVIPKHQASSEVITDALRYVESKQFLDQSFSDAFEDKIVEGYGGVIVEVEERGDEFAIVPRRIPWDRIYFDQYSRNKDFSDSSFFGITLWMDVEDAVGLNPDRAEEVRSLCTRYGEDETFSDRPKYWADSERKRVRVNQEYYLDKGVWWVIYYSGDLVIIDPVESPYLDEDGLPACPIELDSDFVDRENNRWAYMQRLIDVQDEINHRRSKALGMLSRKKVIADNGAFTTMSKSQVLAELAKTESYIEKNSGADVQIDDNQDLGQSQLLFYQDAQNAMDAVGVNPELSGRTDQAISGRAFLARQSSGRLELAKVFANHSAFKRRVYTQIWLRMRQYWTEEKWIRVTDKPDAMRFIGLNIPVTRAEALLEQQLGQDIQTLRDADPNIDLAIQQAVAANPAMGEVVETRNDIKQLYMDIVIEEGPDTAVVQQEQFETIANLAASRADPQMFRALVTLSSMPNKKEVIEMFDGNEQQAAAVAQQQQQQQEMAMAAAMEELRNKAAQTAKLEAEANKTMSEIPLNIAKTRSELAEAEQTAAETSTATITGVN